MRVLNNSNSTDRVGWGRVRWPEAKFQVTSAKSDLGNEQQREKREESREKREERREKTEDRPKETARGPHKRPPEVPTKGTDPCLHNAAPQRVVDRRLESLHFKGVS